MKNKLIKKVLSCFISLAIIFCALPKCECKGLADRFFGAINHLVNGDSKGENESSESEEGNEDEFNFIKNSADDNFFYSGNWLLYGGILFIVISITGMIITLKPKKHKSRRVRRASRR